MCRHDRPHELLCERESFGLSGLCNVVVAADSVIPRSFSLEVEVFPFDEHDDALALSLALSSPSPSPAITNTFSTPVVANTASSGGGGGGFLFDPVRRAQRRLQIVNAVKGTVTSVVNAGASVAIGAKDVALDAAVGVASTAVNAARTIATGNPINIVKEGTDKVFHLASHLVHAVPASLSLQTKNHLLVVSCRDEVFRMHRREAQLSLYIDFYAHDLDVRSGKRAFLDRRVDETIEKASLDTASTSSSQAVVLPEKLPSKLGLDLFLLHGVEGVKRVEKMTRYSIESLLDPFVVKAIKAKDWNELDDHRDRMTICKEIVFNKHIGESLLFLYRSLSFLHSFSFDYGQA